MNDTRVFQIDAAAAVALEQALRAQLPAAEWRRVDHARFAVKALGANLVCYSSGKLVLQGRELDAFQQRFLSGLVMTGPPASPVPFDRPTIGSDEAGKGDYFGPLVVAAVYAEPAQAAALAAMGVADSKTLSDLRMMPMAEQLERTFDCAVRQLEPPEYNERHRADPNVNHLLADLHADAIAALLQRHPDATVVVDRFGDERLVADRLRARSHKLPPLLQVPRAEAHAAVGAASVVARVHFVEGFHRCEEACGTELHKGAGEPVDAAARHVLQIGGSALLRQVAKMHFKNSARLEGLRP